MANFDQYLDIAVESIEKPAAPPIGHWDANTKSWKGVERNFGPERKNVPCIEVTFTLTSAHEDAVESAEAEGLDAEKFHGRVVTRDYELSDPMGLNGLRQLGEVAIGLDTKGLSLRDMLAQLANNPVKLFMDRRPGNEEGQFYPKVAKILKAD
jgi:hypothetical protein